MATVKKRNGSHEDQLPFGLRENAHEEPHESLKLLRTHFGGTKCAQGDASKETTQNRQASEFG